MRIGRVAVEPKQRRSGAAWHDFVSRVRDRVERVARATNPDAVRRAVARELRMAAAAWAADRGEAADFAAVIEIDGVNERIEP
jgi:RecB family exonuclease